MSGKAGSRRGWVGSSLLLAVVVLAGLSLAARKSGAIKAAEAAAAGQPEPMESVVVAAAAERPYHESSTSIGTVLALRSITLRNELSGTVRSVTMTPGQIVEQGAVLVALDVSVEQADLQALEVQAVLAQATLDRIERLSHDGATSAEEVDQARAQRDVARAQIARTKAIIERKTIRAPFRARVGISDVHPGQYLNEGTTLSTLQGVEEAAHVDFAVSQQVAAGLRAGDAVQVFATDSDQTEGRIVAIDARVDPTTRNAVVRARIEGRHSLAPGASVRVVVPVGAEANAVVVPASALRKGPAGDHVFVISADEQGKTRAHVRPVHGGPIVGDEVVVLDGLAAGSRSPRRARSSCAKACSWSWRTRQAPPRRASERATRGPSRQRGRAR
jgi:membrane fusion protein (multidrug efflux system)